MSPSRAPVLSWTHYTGYWKNGRSEPKLLWDLTTDEFLYLPRHILEFATAENYNKREISMVGRSGSGGLRVDMKKVGEGTNAVNKFWLFSMESKTIIFVLVPIQKIIFCKKR